MKDELDLLEEQQSSKRDYGAILVRRRWYLVGPLLICGLVGAVLAQAWHLPYTSEALILVEQQKVPEQYVTPNVITNLQTRLDGMTQQILSRTRLLGLIDQFNLYAGERARLTIDEVVDHMRASIAVGVMQAVGRQGEVTGFRITYSAGDPHVAQRITNELTSLFINESMRQRTQQSTATTDFLQSELKTAQDDLASDEARLREYKLRFLGELPEQQAANLQLLSSLQAQLYTAEAALQRAEQQKTYLAGMKQEYEALAGLRADDKGQVLPGEPRKSSNLTAAESALLDLQRQLVQQQTRLGSRHPDVSQLEAQIASWKTTIRELETANAAKVDGQTKKPSRAAEPSSSVTSQLNLADVENRLKALETETASEQKDMADLQQKIKNVQSRIGMTPVREQQLSAITRSYENSRQQYQSLLQKKLQSELASNLERRQQGEQFRILDPASLPEKPAGRLKILGGGWIIGLLIGVGVALLKELLTGAVHEESDITTMSAVPVFQLPTIRTRREARRYVVRVITEAAGAAILAAAAFGMTARTYFTS
jgi:succinoglycan biosynthesis transport protein ExoP